MKDQKNNDLRHLCRPNDRARQHLDRRQHPALRNRQKLPIFIPPRLTTHAPPALPSLPSNPHQPNPKTHIPVALIKTAAVNLREKPAVRKEYQLAENLNTDHETNERRIAVSLTTPVKQTDLTEIYASRLAPPVGYCAKAAVSVPSETGICGKAAPPVLQCSEHV